MAKFTANVDLNIRLPSGEEAVGTSGTTHRISDPYVTEFIRDVVPNIPGGVTWITQDEISGAGGAIALGEIDGSPSTTGVTSILFPNNAVAISGTTATVSPLALGAYGGMEQRQVIASGGSATTVNLANGNVFQITLDTATCTITFTGATTGVACSWTIIAVQGSAGSRRISWPGAVVWRNNVAPSLGPTAGAVDVITFLTLDGGTTVYGTHAASAMTNPMTTTGDIIYASDTTGTPARLAISGTSTWLRGGTTPSYVTPPGYEYDYVAFVSTVNCTATTEATANTIVTANPVTFDGSTVVFVEFASDYVQTPAGGVIGRIWLYDGTASIGELGVFNGDGGTSSGVIRQPCLLRCRLTPSNGSHTYSVRGSVASGTMDVDGGPGGAGNPFPGYVRIMKA